MEEALTRKSQLAWGACLICVVFLLETVNDSVAIRVSSFTFVGCSVQVHVH